MIAAALCIALLAAPPEEPRTVEGRYRHPGEGFAIDVPKGTTGFLDGDPATERGIQVSLPSGGIIRVFGEANSLEFPSPEAGIRYRLEGSTGCSIGPVDRAKVGQLSGASGRVECADSVTRYLLAFRPRPGGGRIYWLRLDTPPWHEDEDAAWFAEVAKSFSLIRREWGKEDQDGQ